MNTVELLWFTFNQNNSGGYFIENDEVDHYVMIQAPSAKDAMQKADDIFSGNSDFCECCGERWHVSISDNDGSELPEVYGESITNIDSSSYRERAICHLWNGSVARVFFGTHSEGQPNKAEWIKEAFSGDMVIEQSTLFIVSQ